MIFRMHKHTQLTAYDSPWTARQRAALLAWQVAWGALCAWTPKPLNGWRLLVLRFFGAKLEGVPFVHARARIQIPWNLTMRHRACLGDRANAYSLGEIFIDEAATVSQEAYLCTGTHDFSSPAFELVTAPIRVGKGAFVGARAFVMPGVTIGERAIVGACAVLTKNLPPGAVAAGNPAKIRKPMTEDRSQMTEDEGRKTEHGFEIGGL